MFDFIFLIIKLLHYKKILQTYFKKTFFMLKYLREEVFLC